VIYCYVSSLRARLRAWNRHGKNRTWCQTDRGYNRRWLTGCRSLHVELAGRSACDATTPGVYTPGINRVAPEVACYLRTLQGCSECLEVEKSGTCRLKKGALTGPNYIFFWPKNAESSRFVYELRYFLYELGGLILRAWVLDSAEFQAFRSLESARSLEAKWTKR
jgi:hypothetical protein